MYVKASKYVYSTQPSVDDVSVLKMARNGTSVDVSSSIGLLSFVEA